MPLAAPRAARRAAAHAVRASLALLLALGGRPLAAQRLQFRSITPDDGLAASWVPAIAQDRRGFMWFGTVRGLNRYDGYTLRSYQHDAADSTSLPNSRVNALHVDSAGALWVGTDRKSTRLNSSHVAISYAVFCLKKKKNTQ